MMENAAGQADGTNWGQTGWGLLNARSLSMGEVGVPVVAGDGDTPPVQVRRRAPIACRRCRRLRTKCIHENADPPCNGCKGAGPEVAAECTFAARGIHDNDREFRRRRVKMSDVERSRMWEEQRSFQQQMQTAQTPHSAPSLVISPPLSITGSQDPWDLLPPFEELLEGCRVFGTSCIQLGFMPKALYLERLAQDRKSISAFLLLSILSISARFTPVLIQRYGDAGRAGEHFMNCAGQLVLEEMYEPTLERAQAFFLLGIAEWGRGAKNRSSIHMGISVRMAGILRLHREETYDLPPNATADTVVDSEVARRTFWSIQCHDNLYTGHNSPLSFTRSDITTLLPCEESDFAFGRIAVERAALTGTQAADDNPSLTSLNSRSLFATLIQVHNLWGQVARKAYRAAREMEPWSEWSEYMRLTNTLKDFEEKMPDRHRWSLWNFRGYKTEAVDLAYLSIVTITRLNSILIRRVYLEEILISVTKTQENDPPAPPAFWETVSYELFTNLTSLYEAIDTFFSLRLPEEGYPAMLVFCVYICGSLASYLWKFPSLCPPLAGGAEKIFRRSLEVLQSLKHAWPQATTWLEALKKVSERKEKGKGRKGKGGLLEDMSSQEKVLSAADGLSPPTQSLPLRRASTVQENLPMSVSQLCSAPDQPAVRINTDSLNLLSNVAVDYIQHRDGSDESFGAQVNNDWNTGDGMFLGNMAGMGDDNFEADLSDFLNGNAHLGLMEGW